MKVSIQITQEDIARLVRQDLERQFGEANVEGGVLVIEVKSKQNYKSEWEVADFRARLEINS